MNAPWGPSHIVLDGVPDPPQRGEGDPLLNFAPPSYLEWLKLILEILCAYRGVGP